jgi:heterotetrameric sarcosine oxidase delta subunit
LYTIARVSFLLSCPNCGTREVTDFGYGGEVTARPASRPDRRELNAYNYFRRNVAGVQREWWFHRSGCRAWFIAERDTTTNEVKFTALPRAADDPQTPEASKAPGEGVVT